MNQALVSFPQSLQSYLLKPPFSFSNFEYGCFYSFCNLPNILLPLFIGSYLDKYGYSLSLITFCSCFLIFGSFLITIGSFCSSFLMMLIGRILMGGGCEGFQLLIKRFVLILTNKNKSAFFWGMILVAGSSGELVGANLPGLIYSLNENLTICFGATIVIAILICVNFKISIFMSKRTDFQKERKGLLGIEENESLLKKMKVFFKSSETIFWLVILLVILTYMTLTGFFSEMNNLVMKTIDVEPSEAGHYIIFFSLSAAVVSISVGLLFKHAHFYIYLMFFACFAEIISCLLFIFISGTRNKNLVIIPLCLFGMAKILQKQFLFISIGFIVDKKYYGLAYGCLVSSLNIGSFIGPMVFGIVRDSTLKQMNGFLWPLIETIFFQILNIVLTLWVFALDYKYSRVLTVMNCKRSTTHNSI